MNPKSKFILIPKVKVLFYTISILVMACASAFFPFHRLLTNETADNPLNCPYYITLQSVLANYQLLASDKGNVGYIKNRLLQFERDVRHSTGPADIVAAYKNNYTAVLGTFDVRSIKSVTDNNKIIAIAKSNYATVDNYYLDNRLYCINPLYYPLSTHSRRILQYNLAGLYDQIPNRYMRALVAFPNDSQLGIFSGFFVTNQTTSLGTQFLTGMPMLTALYVMPKYNYASVGSYRAMVPWGYFSVSSFIDPISRKVLDIAGIDVFSVLRSYMAAKNITGFTGAVPLKSSINPMFAGDVQSYINTQSYGMAYLANHIFYENPKTISHYEGIIDHYFALSIDRNPAVFEDATAVLYQKLIGLKEKHDILLEAVQKNDDADIDKPAGSVTIEGISGEHALFKTDCARDNCTLVWNTSAAPGWHAFVNGRASKITRANFAFMSTEVPAGQATIWFIYAPLSATISYLISIFSLIGIIAMGYYSRKRIEEI